MPVSLVIKQLRLIAIEFNLRLNRAHEFKLAYQILLDRAVLT
jgi:hypothetical protein